MNSGTDRDRRLAREWSRQVLKQLLLSAGSWNQCLSLQTSSFQDLPYDFIWHPWNRRLSLHQQFLSHQACKAKLWGSLPACSPCSSCPIAGPGRSWTRLSMGHWVAVCFFVLGDCRDLGLLSCSTAFRKDICGQDS